MSFEHAVQPRRLRATRELALELSRERREPRQASARRIGLQRKARGTIKIPVVHGLSGKAGEHDHLTLLDVVAFPDQIAEHGQRECRDAPEEPPGTLLMPR